MIAKDIIIPNEMKKNSLALSKTGDFDIHDYIPYLINRAATALVDQFQTGLKEHGIARLEWRVLAILGQRGPTRFGALASLSTLEQPTLSRTINTLSERKLVIKSRSGIDARGVVIEPTEAGKALVKRILPHAIEVERLSIEGMSHDEAKFLQRLLQRLCDNLSPWLPDNEAKD